MKVRMWTKRAIPVVALVALVSQSVVSYGAMGTKNQTTTSSSTTNDLAAISDSLVLDQSVIVDQGRGYGSAVLNAFDAGEVRMTLNATGEGCNNNSAGGNGPVVSFDGTLSAPNRNAKLKAQTSAKVGAGQSADYWDGAADLTVTLNMANRSFPKQGVYSDGLGNTGVGGNPHIYVRFKNAQGDFPSLDEDANEGWVYLGRCVQGTTNTADLLLNLPGRRHFRAAAGGCTNGASDMSLRMRGGPRLRGEVAFTNQRVGNPSDSVHRNTSGSFNAASLAITLKTGALVNTWSGTRWQGGNPNFGVSFETSIDDPNSDDPAVKLYTPTILLGRCKSILGTLPSADVEIGVDQI